MLLKGYYLLKLRISFLACEEKKLARLHPFAPLFILVEESVKYRLLAYQIL